MYLPHRYQIQNASTPTKMSYKLTSRYCDVPPPRRRHELNDYEDYYAPPEIEEQYAWMLQAEQPKSAYNALKKYADLHMKPENENVLVLDPVIRTATKWFEIGVGWRHQGNTQNKKKEQYLNFDAFRDQLRRLQAKKEKQYWKFHQEGFAIKHGGEQGKRVAESYERALK